MPTSRRVRSPTCRTRRSRCPQKEADDRNWKLGQTVVGRFPLDNATEDFTIGAIYDSPELLGNYFVPEGRVGRRTRRSRSTSSR